jgi:hypothetical protein
MLARREKSFCKRMLMASRSRCRFIVNADHSMM